MIRILKIDEHENWDRIVRSFKAFDVYWLSGYVRAFQLHGDGEPLLIMYENEQSRGINVVMMRDIADSSFFRGKLERGNFFDLATPYGYGGWLIEGNDTQELYKAYREWCMRNRVVSEFVRFHPIIKNHKKCDSFFDVIKLGEVIHMELNDVDEIWKNMTSKNRNIIRKALKNNVKIYNGRYPEIFKKFRAIYNGTMDRDGAEQYYYFGEDFYDSILDDMPENSQIFWAEKDGEVLAASIMLMANRRMTYHLSGSVKEYNSLAPTNLLLYKAACWGCENNYKTLYLGGGVGSGEDSLFKFKKAFYKGNTNHFYVGEKIYDNTTYKQLKGMRSGLEYTKKAFFPEYRAVI